MARSNVPISYRLPTLQRERSHCDVRSFWADPVDRAKAARRDLGWRRAKRMPSWFCFCPIERWAVSLGPRQRAQSASMCWWTYVIGINPIGEMPGPSDLLDPRWLRDLIAICEHEYMTTKQFLSLSVCSGAFAAIVLTEGRALSFVQELVAGLPF